MAAMTLGHQALYVARVEGLELRVEGPADVGRDDGAVDEFAQDTEKGGFATTFHWRFDAEVGTDVAELEAPGVYDPESERFGRVFGKDDEAGKQFAKRVQERCRLKVTGC